MRFIVYGEVTVSCYTVVEARTEAEALAIAGTRSASVSGYEEEEWCVDDADGEPIALSAEEE